MRARGRGAGALLGVLLLVAGCSSAAPADGAAPAGVSVVVRQGRSDQAPHRTQISVTNGGSAPLTVLAAQILTARFIGRPRWRDATPAVIAPRTTVDLPAPLPAAVCPAAGGALAVRLQLQDGGTTRWVRLDATDSEDRLAAVQTEDCALRGVEQIATITPSFTAGAGRGVAGRLTLELRPAGGAGTLTVVAANPTTLLAPGPVPAGATVSGRGAARTVVLPLRPARCDPHALAEDKVGTRMLLDVTVDGVPVRVTLPTGRALMGAAYDLVARYCGTSG